MCVELSIFFVICLGSWCRHQLLREELQAKKGYCELPTCCAWTTQCRIACVVWPRIKINMCGYERSLYVSAILTGSWKSRTEGVLFGKQACEHVRSINIAWWCPRFYTQHTSTVQYRHKEHPYTRKSENGIRFVPPCLLALFRRSHSTVCFCIEMFHFAPAVYLCASYATVKLDYRVKCGWSL